MISYPTPLLWMMRSLLLFSLLSVTLFGAKETIEVFAKHVTANNKNFVADEHVVILYDGAMIKSDHAEYDKNSSLLILEGHVEMLGMDDNRVASNRLVIDTSKKSVKFKKLFLAGEEDLWINAETARKREKDYLLGKSKISSCDVDNPDWTIEFNRAHYHDDHKYVTMKDA
ncbi:MAG: LPS-assembly protein LptD, partial [Sulfurovaceae bacterium]|nr:LPS-assembly protein LptD [Sulfurovaceae bacterium]